MDSIVEEAAVKAKEVLHVCSTPNGLYASGGKDGYTSVWARDSMVSLIGASAATGEFGKVFAKSLNTLKSHQSAKGQIPNCVDMFEKRRLVTFATLDSSLWYILGEHFYKKRFGPAVWKGHKKNIDAALGWVSFQDSGEDMLPEQQPTSDWQDCFPHKYGHTINTQALYFAALNAAGKKKGLNKYVRQVNNYLWSDELGYYLPWHWKDHGKYSEKEKWFDSLGNVLAIVFGLANKRQAGSILDFIGQNGVARPFPLQAIYPAIAPNAKEWKDYFLASLAGKKHQYLNGGIWPFIGGFYVCALVHAGRLAAARDELELLATSNSLGKKFAWDFNEWIHPVTGIPSGGRHQSWSAGAYLLAFEAVKSRENILKFK
ncbi:MAG TPA: hypothetical protein HA254_00430 [Candidatus Diapherotrites archaeon]|uniref:beta-fructofuranosidase n=1 Tax=Candidatus Iainarchaeum sp. TaxID=3101447 RepID=A0A7J4J1L5_9ARCH|nr:hypothetical protein [Candidatus Diapherotrites archaeon]